jgi:hypothetical protein
MATCHLHRNDTKNQFWGEPLHAVPSAQLSRTMEAAPALQLSDIFLYEYDMLPFLIRFFNFLRGPYASRNGDLALAWLHCRKSNFLFMDRNGASYSFGFLRLHAYFT